MGNRSSQGSKGGNKASKSSGPSDFRHRAEAEKRSELASVLPDGWSDLNTVLDLEEKNYRWRLFQKPASAASSVASAAASGQRRVLVASLHDIAAFSSRDKKDRFAAFSVFARQQRMARSCPFIVPIEEIFTDTDNIAAVTVPEVVCADMYDYLYTPGTQAGQSGATWKALRSGSAAAGRGKGGGSKAAPAGRKTEADLRLIFFQVGTALAHLHAHDVLHRNVKPESIKFGADGVVRLDRFMLSAEGTEVREGTCKFFTGTPGYMPPEAYSPASGGYGQPRDVFELGVTMYEAMFGAPFDDGAESQVDVGKNTIAGLRNMKGGAALHRLQTHGSWAPEVRDLVQRMMETKPEARPTMAEVMANPWFDDARGNVPVEKGEVGGGAAGGPARGGGAAGGAAGGGGGGGGGGAAAAAASSIAKEDAAGMEEAASLVAPSAPPLGGLGGTLVASPPSAPPAGIDSFTDAGTRRLLDTLRNARTQDAALSSLESIEVEVSSMKQRCGGWRDPSWDRFRFGLIAVARDAKGRGVWLPETARVFGRLLKSLNS